MVPNRPGRLDRRAAFGALNRPSGSPIFNRLKTYKEACIVLPGSDDSVALMPSKTRRSGIFAAASSYDEVGAGMKIF